MKTVAIIHGWAGGPQHTKHFTNILKQSGFEESDDSLTADVIFAHSAGCYGVPANSKAELVVLHGPPYWPEKSIFKRVFGHVGHDSTDRIKHQGLLHFLRKKWWEIFYVFRYPRMTVTGLLHHRRLDFLDKLSDKKILLIRNQNDQFLSPKIRQVVAKHKNVHYVELPGRHDDFYVEPEPYVDLILKEL